MHTTELEIFTRKTRNGQWEAYDVHGNAATGITKQIALNNYHLIYGIIPNSTSIAQINMDDYKKLKILKEFIN